jgi:hypothetical protein
MGLMAIIREELVGAFTPASFRFQRERREETVEEMMLTGGVHSSAREDGETVPVREIKEDGPRAETRAGPDRFPGALF